MTSTQTADILSAADSEIATQIAELDVQIESARTALSLATEDLNYVVRMELQWSCARSASALVAAQRRIIDHDEKHGSPIDRTGRLPRPPLVPFLASEINPLLSIAKDVESLVWGGSCKPNLSHTLSVFGSAGMNIKPVSGGYGGDTDRGEVVRELPEIHRLFGVEVKV